jgi:GNAT superfamily N-acetyltransferase
MAGPAEDLYPFSDLGLARRLERAEAQSSTRFVEARARIFPGSSAQWIEVAGTYAIFDTASSPLTQTFGLGLFQEVTKADMELIEEFFRERGAPVFHEVSPLAGLALVALLNERGYRPVEFTSVMFRPIRSKFSLVASRNERIRIRLVHEGERELWARIAARGWSEFAELADFMLEIGHISTRTEGTLSFFAESDGQPIATGILNLCEGVALLAGASTVPEGRKQGAQAALLESRLRYAAEEGSDIAMMCAQPGSASQRNAERNGFRVAYTRTKWRLAQSLA